MTLLLNGGFILLLVFTYVFGVGSVVKQFQKGCSLSVILSFDPLYGAAGVEVHLLLMSVTEGEALLASSDPHNDVRVERLACALTHTQRIVAQQIEKMKALERKVDVLVSMVQAAPPAIKLVHAVSARTGAELEWKNVEFVDNKTFSLIKGKLAKNSIVTIHRDGQYFLTCRFHARAAVGVYHTYKFLFNYLGLTCYV